MHRIDTEGNNSGTFSDGNPAVGQLGTLIDAAWYQDLQENIAQAIEHADIVLAKGDFTQLTKAIIAIATGVGGGGGAGAGSVPTSRKVNATGLLTGGGGLDQDVTLTLPRALVADLVAGNSLTAVPTAADLGGLFGGGAATSGTIALPGGRQLKFGGYDQFIGAEGLYHIVFPQPFPNACLRATLTGINGSGSNNRDIWPQLVAKSAAGIDFFAQWTGLNATQQTLDGVDYWAIGY